MEFTEKIAIMLVRRLLIANNHKKCIRQTIDGEYHNDMTIIQDLDNLVLNIYNQLLDEYNNPNLIIEI